MVYGITPKDGGGIVPLSASTVPGVQIPVPLQGSLLQNTDSNSNTTTAATFLDRISEAVLLGQSFIAYSNVTSSVSNGLIGISVFNPSNSGKNVLVTSMRSGNNGGSGATDLWVATANPSYGSTLTPTNKNLGSSTTSVASVTATAATNTTTPTGTRVGGVFVPNFTMAQALTTPILCPKGTASGAVILFEAGTSDAVISVVEWIEY